jgi:hypothetical protein
MDRRQRDTMAWCGERARVQQRGGIAPAGHRHGETVPGEPGQRAIDGRLDRVAGPVSRR